MSAGVSRRSGSGVMTTEKTSSLVDKYFLNPIVAFCERKFPAVHAVSHLLRATTAGMGKASCLNPRPERVVGSFRCSSASSS